VRLVDANVLLYAVNTSARHHERSRRWLDGALSGADTVAFGWNPATLVRTLLAPLGIGGNLVNDAHLAALAIEHRCTIVSFDNDFGRFPTVAWQPPPA
jgi:predicted nucleic acid-binding protein